MMKYRNDKVIEWKLKRLRFLWKKLKISVPSVNMPIDGNTEPEVASAEVASVKDLKQHKAPKQDGSLLKSLNRRMDEGWQQINPLILSMHTPGKTSWLGVQCNRNTLALD